MKKIDELLSEAQRLKDEVALRLHLASAEAKEQYETLSDRLETLGAKASKIGDTAAETAENVADAVKMAAEDASVDDAKAAAELAAEELRNGFERLKKLV